MTSRYKAIHQRIETWFRDALRVVEPRSAVQRVLGWDGHALSVKGNGIPLDPDARLVVVAIGKAAPAMARGAADVLGSRIDRGIVLTKDGHSDSKMGSFEVFEAAHPIPDARGLHATGEILGAVNGLSSQDMVLALISGGGSALLELPREPLTLDDFRQTTRMVMHAGAGIHDLNAVRSVLSQVKGGGLRRAIGEARCVSLLLSDVLGNDPSIIASGPTIQSSPSILKASEVVRSFGLAERLPASVRDFLSFPDEDSGVAINDRDVWSVIADNDTLVAEMKRRVAHDGLNARIQWHGYDGDAAKLGILLVGDAIAVEDDADVLLGGGEATVEVTGEGVGGRNTEAALAAALALQEHGGWCVASLASDGDDGTANAAGAVADPESIARGDTFGLNARMLLASNDSATFFRRADGLVVTGPTGTNVNDIYIAVRTRSPLI